MVARRFAIQLAEACDRRDLAAPITDVALCPEEDYLVRRSAAHAALDLGDEATRARLKPLALVQSGDDPDEDLKGLGLMAVWPAHMSADELFDILTPPVNQHYYGWYHDFINWDLLERLESVHLVAALQWSRNRPHRHGSRDCFSRLVAGILLKAYQHIERPEVLREFGITTVWMLDNDQEILSDDRGLTLAIFRSDDSRRRTAVAEMIQVWEQSHTNPGSHAQAIAQLLTSSDVLWLLEIYQRSKSPALKDFLADVLSWIFDPTNESDFTAMLAAMSSDSVLTN